MYYTTAAMPPSDKQAKQFADDFKKKFGKSNGPYAAEAYVSASIALKAIEAAAKGGKMPTRDDVTAAIRKGTYSGITGNIQFDEKGDPKKAVYYLMQVASDNPEKWADNKEVRRLAIAPPAVAKK
jgi:branched-chain amino acid transport system substrate-binding protein